MTSPAADAPEPSPAASEHARLMDSIYRYQRYIYDVTRKYFLLGRDRLIERMQLSPEMRVLEIGCGTGRNLICLARRHPGCRYYGLDASEEMLSAARAKTKRRAISSIDFRYCLAEDLDYRSTFDLDAPFDTAFFSYALSMIPTWRQALLAALNNLKPGASLWIVDFWDQEALPGWFRWILKRWLALFHVHHKPELIDCLQTLGDSGLAQVTIEPLYGRYAYLAEIKGVVPDERIGKMILDAKSSGGVS